MADTISVDGWSRDRNDNIIWTPNRPAGLAPDVGLPSYVLSKKLVVRVRGKIYWFALVDVGFPAGLCFVTAGLSIWRG